MPRFTKLSVSLFLLAVPLPALARGTRLVRQPTVSERPGASTYGADLLGGRSRRRRGA
jgi:hypothetical protein